MTLSTFLFISFATCKIIRSVVTVREKSSLQLNVLRLEIEFFKMFYTTKQRARHRHFDVMLLCVCVYVSCHYLRLPFHTYFHMVMMMMMMPKLTN